MQYLAHLLLGDGASELGDSRSVVSVAFQQAPEHSVDDLVIHAARADEPEPSMVLALAVCRAPDLVQSNESSRKLICTFVQEVVNAPTDGPDHRAALVVAGQQEHAEQLAVLAAEAATHKDVPNFFGLLRTHRKFSEGVRTRLTHIEELVKLALSTLGTADPRPQLVQQRTWELLSRLTVLMPRLETPDELDWAQVTNSLIPVARGTDLYGATRLLERLVALADEYPPKAATVDLSLLRRDAHQVLDSATRRHRQGWGHSATSTNGRLRRCATRSLPRTGAQCILTGVTRQVSCSSSWRPRPRRSSRTVTPAWARAPWSCARSPTLHKTPIPFRWRASTCGIFPRPAWNWSPCSAPRSPRFSAS
nr:hypothetical protein [Streptomyces antimycoticus]